NLQHDPGLGIVLESWGFHLQTIGTHRKIRERILAARIGDRGVRKRLIDFGHADLGIRNRTAALIGYDTANLCNRDSLALKSSRRKQDCRKAERGHIDRPTVRASEHGEPLSPQILTQLTLSYNPEIVLGL